MRAALIFNPRALIERLATESITRRRLGKLKNTPAEILKPGHIDSLELLEYVKSHGEITVIYDIGANTGTWTLLAKALFPEARVECFEPLDEHFQRFEDNTKNLEKVNLTKLALGSENCVMDLNITTFTDASSLLNVSNVTESLYNVYKSGVKKVEVVKLDDYVESNNLPHADLIKLDIQGFELEALKGAPKSMRFAKFILLEVCFKELYVGQPLFEEVINFMFANNYRAVGFSDSITSEGDSLTYTDILFKNHGLS